ncbi:MULTISPECIES: 1-acyl-sn-glycerol-3-phosphate acyltransferase [unclassified Pseudomonas]|uniref:lysophospholipid acyltransferase family protein n=1 Tax=unclassified Pseudomonas TaxID=196821 RepID=UPI000BCC1D67|nr:MULTISPECIES: lysophospholipid acyltransferase family protein [unclassified Pseudomonas]PVZ10559.1 1-acyl-sn-glycerol-3-phosphate acyltransferase [Pseudomonas sp. URIL14HWK12:I12]PVZ21985.1 1-acyl-sn-glycerol-3-phosphate acyltransferase [Pseudomonas sp. URIL14HWK12:I10]PVZ30932.1 1-acyl-sn-glycerol-3-phosphate acyltransferase [Pseudomonas sp. URIL14HWK12:I11]SNZ17329.1 1-acyl-sn-glycerol-3-phosphate acyltransferase [Pseudomonas sp. URIL14HWK12:I9]
MTKQSTGRVALFYFILASSSLVWCTLSVVIAPFLPFAKRYRFVNGHWCRFAIFLARIVLKLDVRITGVEHIPAQPCVIVSNHQSTWETFFLSAYFQPMSQVLKRELLFVPFFGWAMAMLRPIAINRDNPKEALKLVATEGDKLLKDGVWVLIFPEGTRVPYGQIGKFTRSGAALAANAELPVLPIAHNAGKYWPREGWGKYSGTIELVIGEPMYAQGKGPRDIAALNDRVQAWNASAQRAMGSLPETAETPAA